MSPTDCSRMILSMLVVLFFNCGLGEGRQRFSRQPSNVTVWAGETVVLPCAVEGTTGAVQWTRDQFGMGIDHSLPEWPRMSMVRSNNSSCFCSLQIVNVQVNDSGVYQCQAGATPRQPGIRSENAWLTVLAYPSDPVILQGHEVTTRAGTLTELTCVSEGGHPLPKLVWSSYSEGENGRAVAINPVSNSTRVLAEGNQLSVRSVVRFRPVAAHHDTSITCTMTSDLRPGQMRHVVVKLHVQHGPEVSLTPEVVEVAEYGDAVFNCSATANPVSALIYSWLVNGQLLRGEVRGQLVLRSVGRQLNNARVTCQVTGQVGVAGRTGQLRVFYAPRLVSDLEDISAESGQQVTLTCDVEGNPLPDIRWVKHDCDGCKKIVALGWNLTLNVSQDTAGFYECRAVSPGFPVVTSGARVWLRGAPIVTALSPQKVTLGQPGFVECQVEGTPLPTSTNWYMYERRLNREDGHFRVVNIPSPGGITSRLLIDEVIQSDYGVYNCSFGNEYGWHSAIVVLQSAGGSSTLVLCVSAVLGCSMLLAAFILWLVLRRRLNKTAPAMERNEQPATKLFPNPRPVQKQDNIALSLANSRTHPERSASVSPPSSNNLQIIASPLHSQYYGTLSSEPSTYSTLLNLNRGEAEVLPSILQQRHLFYGSHSAMYANPDKKCHLTLSRLPPPPSYRSSLHLATHV